MSLIALIVVSVNINSGVAADTLNEFGTQTGAQVLFDFVDMSGFKTNAVQGRMDMFVALDRMIEGTPLRYEYVNKRTVTVALSRPPILKASADDGLTRVLIADECSFGLIPAEIAAQELGDVPQSCWCCVSYAYTGSAKEASCVALPSHDVCSVYDTRPHRNLWSSGVTSEVVVTGAAPD